jgi:K+-transporting ATPase KdpF subunit
LARKGDIPLGRWGVNAVYIISGLLTLGLFVYLLYAMFRPEKF